MLIKSNDAIIGIPSKTAPTNIIELHFINNTANAWISIKSPIGSNLKLSSSREIIMVCPPRPKNISVEQTTINCEITGTFPIFASIIFAILNPIEVDML